MRPLICGVVAASMLVAACDPEPDDTLPSGPKQILFGDLHVHSTYSNDALIYSAPFLGGNGFLPPELHCDFARYCSQLDFWSINDHPESILPSLWTKSKQAIRTCNQLTGGDGSSPRMVSFLGWEWTHNTESPAAAWGHKNVIFRDTGDDKVPARAIGSSTPVVPENQVLINLGVGMIKGVDSANTKLYDKLGEQMLSGFATDTCSQGVDTRKLPANCREIARDPAELFEKLAQWGYPAIVIPHGTAWGAHNPVLGGWSVQLNRRHHSPRYQRLIEVFSGHGNSEEYRPWRAAVKDSAGKLTCPKPSKDYLPCCWQAGVIARAKTTVCKADPASAACDAEVARVRQAHVDAKLLNKNKKVGDYTPVPADWLDCGQCTDCFQPAFLYRPGLTTQASLALTGFEKPGEPLRYKWGLIGSTDSHKAGPGAGYKELRQMGDIIGPARADFDAAFSVFAPMVFPEWERQSSYLYTGALVAVHSQGRSRRGIWQALERKEVYATSGERILLWFDLVNGPGGAAAPMGSEVKMSAAPRFKIRAVGAFAQKPGCPADVQKAAGADFIKRYCFGECYNPTDKRQVITKVEVIKIEPQISAGEALDKLIQDPYRTLTCPGKAEGCEVTFTDDAYPKRGRPATYYVRVHQAPTLQYNAAGLRCTRDKDGKCAAIKPCLGGHKGAGDNCMARDAERAWSSPIFLEP